MSESNSTTKTGRKRVYSIIPGQKFGKLEIIREISKKDGRSWYECRCECGTVKEIRRYHLTAKKPVSSCGCLMRRTGNLQNRFKHGLTGSSEYKSWVHARERCDNESGAAWNDYGGRGITFCARWRGPNGFANFLADMGRKPTASHQIDRFPDNNGNYEPGNCRWATVKQQQRNKRNNHLVTYNGETHCIMEWAEKLNLNADLVYERMSRGKTFEEAIINCKKAP